MDFLRNYLDKQKPKFEKGSKLEKFHSVFTGFESFLSCRIKRPATELISVTLSI